MFPEMLKYFRKREKLSQKELAAKIGVAQNTISMYESGRREPDFETLEAFADFFNVSMSMLLGEDETIKAPAQHLTDLQKKYNALDDHGRELVDLVLGAEYKRCMNIEKQAEIVPIQMIRHYLVPAAAGYASPIEGEDYEDIPLPDGAPAGADFCITVRGDSMEPYIPDGSLAYVKRGASLQEFDVGIFYVDGDALIKQWCVDYGGTLHLLSANPKREDANRQIPKGSTSTVVCFGKVLLDHRLPAPIYQ